MMGSYALPSRRPRDELIFRAASGAACAFDSIFSRRADARASHKAHSPSFPVAVSSRGAAATGVAGTAVTDASFWGDATGASGAWTLEGSRTVISPIVHVFVPFRCFVHLILRV